MLVYDEKKAENGTYFGEIEENSDDLDRAVYIKMIDEEKGKSYIDQLNSIEWPV